MKNHEIKATWNYHNGTKHPNGILLSRFHVYTPANRPIPYKDYKNSAEIRLHLVKESTGVAALDAISERFLPPQDDVVPDINILSRILFFSSGITKTIQFPSPIGPVDFRAASCTGALYHIEIYVACTDIDGLAAGVYYFNPQNFSLVMLRSGDYRKFLAHAAGNEQNMEHAPVILIFTDIFSRNAIKYQAREYRHAFWDCGTILANTLAISSAHKIPHRLLLAFIDSEVNSLLGLETRREATLALLPIGHTNSDPPDSPPLFGKILESVPSECEIDFPEINNVHNSSSLESQEEIKSWRRPIPRANQATAGAILLREGILSSDYLEETIIRRGSTRKFSHDSISFEQLSTILSRSNRGFNSDFVTEDTSLNDIYLIVNAVDKFAPGAYFHNRENNSLVLLRSGNFRGISGHLGLDQNLPYDASVSIFFMTDLRKILEHFGNRGYRAAQLEAGIIGGRVYLASYALGLGATGLTFYDDEVTEFFSPHAKDKSTMLMMVVGKKARKL